MGTPPKALPHQQIETGTAKNINLLNPNLNVGGLFGALIGALIPIGVFCLLGVPFGDTIGMPVGLCFVAGALSGNYAWGLRVNKTRLGAVAIIMGLAIRLVAGFAIGLVAAGLISRFTGGEERQKREGARRALIKSGATPTPEAISNLVQIMNVADEVEQIRSAAEQGNASAQYHLGGAYLQGLGVPQDDAEAMKWCRKAAEQGYAPAQSGLGGAYLTGNQLPQNHAEAAKWLRKAAEQGDADAQINFGFMCENGLGVPQNRSEAIKWYRMAAAQGNEEAYKALDVLGRK